MAYENPKTIRDVLQRINTHEYVLPAIQREFVWKPSQIEVLFDSLMRGYPIGSFLFWQVDGDHVGEYRYYDFVRQYHQRDAPHCTPLDVFPGKDVIAVLDGQQRLTALNVGLRGAYAEKEPRMWWNNPDAFPWKHLYLNLLTPEPDEGKARNYEFRFLTEQKALEHGVGLFWFRVSDIMDLKAGPDLLDHLLGRNVQDPQYAFRRLHELHDLVHREPVIHYYIEHDQDLEKVLDIFIRVNSGGTVLSYSDLLLSIATAQWRRLSAREAIHDLVDRLNRTRNGFSFSKDFVLKAGLMLADIASVGFQVKNFTHASMGILEEKWGEIDRSLELAIRLVADFGFDDQTLSADSALLPIAYYMYHRSLSNNYLTHDQHRDDRSAVHSWLTRSLVKPGIWGAGLDATLTALRSVIKEHGSAGFPIAEIEAEMTRRGRSLRFENEEIEDLVDVGYGDRRSFALLALLYPFVDLRNQFHIDHFFPQNAFKKKSLLEGGVSEADADELIMHMNRLPNLQLLEGKQNNAKQDLAPDRWLAGHIPDMAAQDDYRRRHDLPSVPADITSFMPWYAARRQMMLRRLKEKLVFGSQRQEHPDDHATSRS